jgi:hypothetical protein
MWHAVSVRSAKTSEQNCDTKVSIAALAANTKVKSCGFVQIGMGVAYCRLYLASLLADTNH